MGHPGDEPTHTQHGRPERRLNNTIAVIAIRSNLRYPQRQAKACAPELPEGHYKRWART